MVEWTLDTPEDILCAHISSDSAIFSFYIENVDDLLCRRMHARIKRSGIYSRINSDDRKSNKQMAEEVAIRPGARILKTLSPERTFA